MKNVGIFTSKELFLSSLSDFPGASRPPSPSEPDRDHVHELLAMPFFELPNDESEGALYWEVFGGEETAQSIESLDRSKETVLFLPRE